MIESPKWRCCCVGCKEQIPAKMLMCRKHAAMARTLPDHIRRGLDAALTSNSDAAAHALDQARAKIAQREGLWRP